ncbi:ABC-type Na+ efflux pump, permease component [Natrarchaeobaculum sulfurireducens]|uniref:ABC-type Na+ efflux pump, permease component n=2 Tax=Natrarchaeobaculum sulfurireducens TaxID=2044521 RepID=A0A346PPF2_9EURY|nr:ABC-type Na+ efflux pump, permease component [Natrarchaeobaculum sulfurireducens]
MTDGRDADAKRADDSSGSVPRSGAGTGGLRGRVSRTVRVARWEVTRSMGTVDRKTILLVLAMVAVAGVVGLSAVDEGLALEDEIYVVGVDEGDPYHDVAVESTAFRPIPLSDVALEDGGADGNVDVVIADGQIGHVGTNGEAAYDAFRGAVETYNERRMAAETDETAAYPVLVTLEYQDRDLGDVVSGDETVDDGGDESTGFEPETDETAAEAGDDGVDDEDEVGTDDGENGDDEVDGGAESRTDDRERGTDADDEADDENELETGDSDPGADDEVDDGERQPDGAAGADARVGSADDELAVPDVGGGHAAEQTAPATPGTLSPPFPFQSLVLAFLFVVPMNFVIQAYGSTIMDERIKRRGELLLVSPAGRLEIVAGKTLPYLLGLVGISVAIALAIGGGLLSIAGAIPIALAFLAATFTGAMFARSFKELTFVTVTISVVLTTYAFVPAIFTDVTPIALISPLTLIVMDLQGESVRLAEYLFSTGPLYFGAAVCALLGIGVYREEDMFAQKAIPSKAVDAIVSQIDAISSRVHPYASPFVLSALFIPFVFAAQLLVVALLFAVPEAIALPVVFVLAAAIEEFAKSIHVYAGFARSRFDASLRVAAVLGVLSGVGFFLGEKVTHAVQFVGLPELTVGVAAFGPALSSEPLVLVALFLAPLVLHVVTAVVAAFGAAHSQSTYAVAFVLATLMHAAYNLGVVALVG